jgi:hypothetical protein
MSVWLSAIVARISRKSRYWRPIGLRRPFVRDWRGGEGIWYVIRKTESVCLAEIS